jgi:putative Mg2+ transporter-C (MgtC) family protein
LVATPGFELTPTLELALLGRLALSVVLGGVLGWERQLGQQPAGLRTHMLVSMGATAYTLAGVYGVAGNGTVQDAGRVSAQIVTGIGFIGAGAIWRSTGNERVIRGLTTASTIWMAASIGMLCGYGLYLLAVGASVLTVIVLRAMLGLERFPGAVWTRMQGLTSGRRASARRAHSPAYDWPYSESPGATVYSTSSPGGTDGTAVEGVGDDDGEDREVGSEVSGVDEESDVSLQAREPGRPHKARGKNNRKKPKGKRRKPKVQLNDQIQD